MGHLIDKGIVITPATTSSTRGIVTCRLNLFLVAMAVSATSFFGVLVSATSLFGVMMSAGTFVTVVVPASLGMLMLAIFSHEVTRNWVYLSIWVVGSGHIEYGRDGRSPDVWWVLGILNMVVTGGALMCGGFWGILNMVVTGGALMCGGFRGILNMVVTGGALMGGGFWGILNMVVTGGALMGGGFWGILNMVVTGKARHSAKE